MGGFSLTHILILLVIFLLFFGPSRLPQLGQSLGKAIRGFKQGLSELDSEINEAPKAPEQLAQNQQPTAQDQKSEIHDTQKRS